MRLVLLGLLVFLALFLNVSGNLVFPVDSKFKGKERSLRALKDHDTRRHRRILSAVDLELGGNGLPSETGLVSFGFFFFPRLYWVFIYIYIYIKLAYVSSYNFGDFISAAIGFRIMSLCFFGYLFGKVLLP